MQIQSDGVRPQICRFDFQCWPGGFAADGRSIHVKSDHELSSSPRHEDQCSNLRIDPPCCFCAAMAKLEVGQGNDVYRVKLA